MSSILDAQLVYAFPLVLAVSLVYGATRHEHVVPILMNALRSALWISAFMVAIFLILWFAGRGL